VSGFSLSNRVFARQLGFGIQQIFLGLREGAFPAMKSSRFFRLIGFHILSFQMGHDSWFLNRRHFVSSNDKAWFNETGGYDFDKGNWKANMFEWNETTLSQWAPDEKWVCDEWWKWKEHYGLCSKHLNHSLTIFQQIVQRVVRWIHYIPSDLTHSAWWKFDLWAACWNSRVCDSI